MLMIILITSTASQDSRVVTQLFTNANLTENKMQCNENLDSSRCRAIDQDSWPSSGNIFRSSIGTQVVGSVSGRRTTSCIFTTCLGWVLEYKILKLENYPH